MSSRTAGQVVAVSRSPGHTFSKPNQPVIRLLEGRGVEGDAHQGATVKHRSRVAREPEKPNLRQVHLIPQELHQELAQAGFTVGPGQMGENITTSGIDLQALPAGTCLRLGDGAEVEITGLRTPCSQLNGLADGLMAALIGRDDEGRVVRKAGVMGVVRSGGDLRPGDAISVHLPDAPHRPLEPV